MCLQDRRIARRTTRTSMLITLNGSGFAPLPGGGRLAMVAVGDGENIAYLAVRPSLDFGDLCVADNTLEVTGFASRVYTAESLQSDAYGVLWIAGTGGEVIPVIRWDYDSDTMNETFAPL